MSQWSKEYTYKGFRFVCDMDTGRSFDSLTPKSKVAFILLIPKGHTRDEVFECSKELDTLLLGKTLAEMEELLKNLSPKEEEPPAVNLNLVMLKAEVLKMRKVVEAAENLVIQKGRHNTEIAYNKLVQAVKEYQG
jgi:hypothetical protein